MRWLGVSLARVLGSGVSPNRLCSYRPWLREETSPSLVQPRYRPSQGNVRRRQSIAEVRNRNTCVQKVAELTTLFFCLANSLLLFLYRPPSYEWDFSDYSPPLAAFAAWMIYDVERSLVRENGDKRFLRRMFFALNNFYSWYVNLADHRLIGGSFLGLDNSQVLNRSKMHEYPAFEAIYQVDGTAWCAAMGMAMMKIALELDMGEAAALFFCNAVCRGHAMNNFEDGLERPGFARPALWSEGMGWYLDCVKYTGKQELQSLKCRTLIGMVPLFAAQCFFSLDELAAKHPLFADHVAEFTWAKLNKQHTQKVISVPVEDLPVPVEEEQTVLVGGDGSRRLGMFLTDKEKLRVMLRSILDEDRFLSAYGIRSASKELEREPYNFDCGDGHGWKQYKYLPRESYSDGKLFGGNSSWRGGMLISLPGTLFLPALCDFEDMCL